MSDDLTSTLRSGRRSIQKWLSDRLSRAAERLRPRGNGTQDWGVGRTPAEQVEAAYRRVLNRASEPSGQAHWEKFLARGGRFEEMLRRFTRSAEFKQRMEAHRGPSPEGHQPERIQDIYSAYRCLLSREPDPEGMAHWCAFLLKGGSVDEMLLGFLRSAEFTRRLDDPSPPLPVPPLVVAEPKHPFGVIGDVQGVALMRCVQALSGLEMPTLLWSEPQRLLESDAAQAQIAELFSRHHKVFVQPAFWDVIATHFPEFTSQVILFPAVSCRAFHPDIVEVRRRDSGLPVLGPCQHLQSSIAFLGWRAGLSAGQTVELFNTDIFSELGFFETWDCWISTLLREGRSAGMDLEPLIESWRLRGCFMHSMNHPKLFVMLDIARALLENNGFNTVRMDIEPYVFDWQAQGAIWPVYPEVGRRFGLSGHYNFKRASPDLQPNLPLETLGLEDFVAQSFVVFSQYGKDELICDCLETAPYQRVLSGLTASAARPTAANAEGPATPGTLVSAIPTEVELRFAVLGNCQAQGMARCLQALVGGPMPYWETVTPESLAEWESGRSSPTSLFSSVDKILVQPWIWKVLAPRYSRFESKVVLYPLIAFIAYQPDVVDLQVRSLGTMLSEGPLGPSHSSLAFLCWYAGLDVSQTVAVFRPDVMASLGHQECWHGAELALLDEGRAAGMSLAEPLARWKSRGCFMHQPAHPKLFVIADLARMILERLGLPGRPIELAEWVHDPLADGPAWPVYPGIAEGLGLDQSYEFKASLAGPIGSAELTVLSLSEFVEQSFAVFSRHPREELFCTRLAWPSYLDLIRRLEESKTLSHVSESLSQVMERAAPLAPIAPPEASKPLPVRRTHPYAGLPPHCFWRKAVGEVALEQVDPVLRTKFHIQRDTRVATAGSCFALHISRQLSERGFNFMQTEPVPHRLESSDDAEAGSAVFSARFGYVYTARQLRQLIERAYGRFLPSDAAWPSGNGGWVDPFRPTVEPGGFRSVGDLEKSRQDHLTAVRRMFETLDVFVFTLGLTEAWRARADGAVFPLAPGVAGGEMNSQAYEFVNFTVDEVEADLEAFIRQLQTVNPRARLILTVSPVPLVATYRDRHVLVSTVYSKSVLRVAAERVSEKYRCCDYFPSYEVITGNFNRGRYFAKDLRSVEQSGVDHVMRLFFRHYAQERARGELAVEKSVATESDAELFAEAMKNVPIVCDEELLEAAVR